MRIEILINGIKLNGELKDSPLAGKIAGLLPLKASGSTWGEEIYFPIPVKAGMSNPQSVVSLGEIAFWGEGSCLCFFYGLTPISSPGQIKPASPVEVVGKLIGDLEKLKTITGKVEIEIKRV